MKATDRISVRLIIIFVSVTTALLALFGAYSYIDSKTTMEGQLLAHAGRTVARLQIGLPAPIWNFDGKLIPVVIGEIDESN